MNRLLQLLRTIKTLIPSKLAYNSESEREVLFIQPPTG